MDETRGGQEGLFPDAGSEPDDGADPRRRSLVEWAVVVAGAIVVALLVKTFVVQAFYIPTGSMEPTLLGELRSDGTRGTGDRVVVDKVSYRLHGVNRGDVVVFANPDRTATDHLGGGTVAPVEDLIKRVIALPGETVVIRDGHVYVDGGLLAEPYLPASTTTTNGPGNARWTHTCTPADVCTVPAGTVWVMGDNRTNSQDSRFIGPIAQDTIVGRATTIVWPPNRISGL